MAFIQREQIADPVSIREHHQGRIGQADLEVGVPRDDAFGGLDVFRPEGLEPIHAASHLGQERALGLLADASGQEVVQLGKYEGRQTPRR